MTDKQKKYDIIIFGATPCGIAAAIAAARRDHKVLLTTQTAHIGGMMANGLSITDLRFISAYGGIFDEFRKNILAYYCGKYGEFSSETEMCCDGLWFEPHVAQCIFESMLENEHNIELICNCFPLCVLKSDNNVKAVDFETINGLVFTAGCTILIDASYEGDAAALAGIKYRIGRESRLEYYEAYTGKIFLAQPSLEILRNSTGEGDNLIQAYNFRLCMTNREEIRILPDKPDNYDRDMYLPLIGDIKSGTIREMNDIIRLAPLPCGKYNGNNRPISVSLDLPEINTDYPDGSRTRRLEIYRIYRDYTVGLIWFLQNDIDLPESFKIETRKWGLCADEFTDNDYIPRELYVREARRICGRYTFTSNDAFLAADSERTPVHIDSIATGDYHVDSHQVQRKRGDWEQYEGHVYLRSISKPAQIPYGVMVPEGLNGIFVPGAMSATHLGFSVLRMEPTWMALGQAAAIAASIAITCECEVAEVDIEKLQSELIAEGQIITFFYDVPGPDKIWMNLNKPGERTSLDHYRDANCSTGNYAGIKFFGTKGFFTTYFARPKDPVTRYEAAGWLYKLLTMIGLKNDNHFGEVDFKDIEITNPLRRAISILCEYNIMTDWEKTGCFYGSAILNRDDAQAMIAAVFNESPEWMEIPKPENPKSYITREDFCDCMYYCYMKNKLKRI